MSFVVSMSMVVFMADGASGDQFACQIGFDCDAGASLDADDDFDAAFVEDVNGSAAHAAGDDDRCAVVCDEVGEETRAVTGIWNAVFSGDLAVFRVEEDEVLAMSEMSGDDGTHCCYCDFFHDAILLCD